MSMVAATTPNKFLHGDNGAISFTISAVETEFNVVNADFTVEAATEDVTHSGANGWFVPLGGTRKVSGTLTYVYDLANKPGAATPYDLLIATTATMKIYANVHQAANLGSSDVSAPDAWAGPAFISNHKFKTGPKAGAMEVTCDFVSSGAWTGPTIA